MNNFYEFGRFRIDLGRHVLLRQGEPVVISNKAFDLLQFLVENRDRVMTKDELLDKIWTGVIVEENNLTVAMSGLRKALGEGPTDRRYIMTVPGKGYRFVGEVREVSAEESPAWPVANLPSQIPLQPRDPTNRQSTLRWLIPLLVVALLAAGAMYYWMARRGRTNATPHSLQSIAVLPFKIIGGAGPDDQYLGAGVADAVNTKLSNLNQFTVRPMGSVFRYQDSDDPVTAGKELGVDAVLDGQIQQSGQRIRVTVQLIAARDGTTLWADTIDEPFTNVFEVEDSIAAGIADLVTPQLTEAQKKSLSRRYTQNPEAYRLYMQGRYLWDKNTEEPMLKSLNYFQQAITADPGFALAYAGIADAYSDLAIQGYLPSTIAFPKVKTAALKALEIDPTLAEPHNSLGVVAWAYDWDWRTADAEFQRAAVLNPDSVATHIDRGFYFLTMKRFDESVAEGKRAADLSPASASVLTGLGYFNFAAQRYQDSAAWLAKALDLDPEEPFAQAVLAADYALSGKTKEALSEYSKLRDVARSGRDPLATSIAGYACAIAGEQPEALLLLKRLLDPPPQRYVDPYAVATLYSALGQRDKAFDLLERAYQQRSASVVFINFDPLFSSFHSDPRFQDLIRRAGLPN